MDTGFALDAVGVGIIGPLPGDLLLAATTGAAMPGMLNGAVGAGLAPPKAGTVLNSTQSLPPSGQTRSCGTTWPCRNIAGKASCGYGPYVWPSRAK